VVSGVHSCFQTAPSPHTNDFIIRKRHRRPYPSKGAVMGARYAGDLWSQARALFNVRYQAA
jgi:hypothetical protein